MVPVALPATQLHWNFKLLRITLHYYLYRAVRSRPVDPHQKLFTGPDWNPVELDYDVTVLDSRDVRGTAAIDIVEPDAEYFRPGNLNSRYIVAIVSKLSATLRALLIIKLLSQVLEFGFRNRRELGRMGLAISQVNDVNRLSRRRTRHYLFHIVFVQNSLTIEIDDHIASDQSCFIRRTAR